ncbi:cupredoxin domain-containing protein [Paenibacillus lutrae]|uniref:Cytochrome C oxidase subunit II n=1 Tax=Paenibacillus lutrae TaxID=2078573 RepID=A0A7X3JYG0_9BACL|nr:cupredoxin domain-containing protein [Paenibacillus lutrae]MVO98942.1 cytochrome C oxidase subunit II [Paenibacillus lutrae]
MKKSALLLIMSVVLILALAACGKTEEKAGETTVTPTQEISVEASNWKFDKDVYTVKKGEPLKISLNNKEGMHALQIPDLKVSVDGGKSKVFTPDKAGTYTIQCSIPCGSGHSTMTAKLVVE